jgi:hypothetical protein
MAQQIYVPIYQKNDNVLLNPNRSLPENGITFTFPTDGFFAEPAYILVNNVQMNAVIKVIPSALNQPFDSYYTPYTVAQINGLSNQSLGLYSATFFDSTLQTNGGATTANQVLINSTQNASGFTLNNNRIDVVNTATYFISALFQLSFTGGASNYNVTVWYTVNDVIVPNSAFTFTTTGAQNDQTLANITDTIEITAGQYLKFYWWSQATGMRLLPTVAGTNPTRPASPSVNISIFNVA